MSLKHLNNEAVSGILAIAEKGQRAWDRVPGYQYVSDDYGVLAHTLFRVVEERNSARASAQRMHKKTKALQKQVKLLERDLCYAQMNRAALEKKLHNFTTDANARIDGAIRQITGQLNQWKFK